MGRRDLDVVFCGVAYGGVASGHKVMSRLGVTGMPIVDVEAGCASGAAALMLAASGIRAGQYRHALVLGIEKMPRGMIRSSFFEPWQEEAGLAATPSYFALRAQRLMRTSGVTKDHLAAVVVKNRRHGVHNPDAMSAPTSTPPPCSARGWCASRSTSSCSARPARAPGRWCSPQARRRAR